MSTVIAVIALMLSGLALRDARFVRRRSDAELVHALVTDYRNIIERPDVALPPVKSTHARVVVINGSSRPIHDIMVGVLPWDWTLESEMVRADHYHAMRPNSESEAADFDDVLPHPGPERGWDPPPVELQFRTARDGWRRLPDGQLYRRIRLPLVGIAWWSKRF